MTQPTDAQKFAALLEKGKTPSKHVVVDGWTIFSDTQAALTAFQAEAGKGKLADDGTYKQATADLPSKTNITAYVNGATAISALKSALPQAGAVPTGQLEWLGAALSTQPDSVKLVGAVKSGQLPGQTFNPTLLTRPLRGAPRCLVPRRRSALAAADADPRRCSGSSARYSSSSASASPRSRRSSPVKACCT